ncbi:MAG TPA: hypothetical protein VJA16_11160 [Thermoanaerobaculia bacterium]
MWDIKIKPYGSESVEEYKPVLTNETAKKVILAAAPILAGTTASVLSHGNPVLKTGASEGMRYLCRGHPQAVTETTAVGGAMALGVAAGVGTIVVSLLAGPVVVVGAIAAGVVALVREQNKQ